MNNDIITRLEEVSNRITSEWDAASGLWHDGVSERFGETFVEPYKMAIGAILDGQCTYRVAIEGMGLRELMQDIDKKARELESLTGIPCEV